MTMRQESERGYMVQIAMSAIIRVQLECHAIDGEAAQEHVEWNLDAIQEHVAGIIGEHFRLDARALKKRAKKKPAPLDLLLVTVDHDPKAEPAEVEDVSEL